MQVKQQFIGLGIILLYFSACTFVQTKPELEEFHIVNGATEKVSYMVEVASDNSSRKRGLMHRKAMALNHGMLLDYKRPQKIAIWMKNTYLSLDIIFIDKEGGIVKLHEGAEPLSLKRIESGSKVRSVLEVNAGQIEEHGIEVGDQVQHYFFGSK